MSSKFALIEAPAFLGASELIEATALIRAPTFW